MTVTVPPLQELGFVQVTANSSATSAAAHGAAASPAIGFTFTTTAIHPNVDIEISIDYLSVNAATTAIAHIVIDGTCVLELRAVNATASVSETITRRGRVFGLAAGPHMLVVNVGSSSGTTTITATSVSPCFVRAVEAP
jgi:hypothetical protein